MDEINPKSTLRKYVFYITIALVVISVIALYWTVFLNRINQVRVFSNNLVVAEVIEGPFLEYVTMPGTVVPIRTIFLGAYISGRVDSIYKEVGDSLEKGEAILSLSNPNIIMDIMQREAEVFEQSNFLRNTQVLIEQKSLSIREQLLETDYQLFNLTDDYNRKKQLYVKGLIPESEFKTIEYEYQYLLKKKELTLLSFKQDSIYRAGQINSLEQNLKRMEENLAFFKSNVEQLTILASVSGRLISLDAEIGEQILSGKKLGQIDDLSGYKLRIEADQHWLKRISVGMVGHIILSRKKYSTKVTRIFPEIISRVFTFEMQFDDSLLIGIHQGQTLYAEIPFDSTANAMMVPKGNFYSETGGSWIYVLNEAGDAAFRRPVELGRQNTRYFEVKNGLKAGEQVIVSGFGIWDADNDRLNIYD